MLTSSKPDEARMLGRGTLVKSSFAVTAAALVVAFTAAASTGSPNRLAAPECGTGVWPATALGRPAALAPSGSSAVYVWFGGGGWHLRVRGAQSLPVTGKLSANAQLRGVQTVGGTHSSLAATGRRLTFSVTGSSGLQGVDVQASCATRLSFTFGSSTPGVALEPQIYLGAKGQAPAASFALARPATTGVAGRILVGPTCPVVGAPDCPPARTVKGTIRIEQAPTSRGGNPGGVVARVASDANGHFAARLVPGHYLLVVEQGADSYPRAKPSLVDVQNGVVSEVTLVLDTGIR
jgi:hypothetical protein